MFLITSLLWTPQLEEKEKKLTETLQKREEHQGAVQQTTAKLDELQRSLEGVDPSKLSTEELQDKIRDRQVNKLNYT